MFWHKAHSRYASLTPADEDIRRYLALPSRFQEEGYRGLVGYVQDLGHRWVAGRTPPGRALEIGFGTGRHAALFRGRAEDYFVSEYSARHCQASGWEAFRGRGVRCDARRLPYRDHTFQAVISIYNLEHIADLDSVLAEVHRVLKPGGRFLVALPCEGGLLWNVGRELTTRRFFQRRYGLNYDKIIAYEHVWDLRGVCGEIVRSGRFRVERRRMFPFGLGGHHCNLVACFECSPATRDSRDAGQTLSGIVRITGE